MQAHYQSAVTRHLTTPNAMLVQRLQWKIALESRLEWYYEHSAAPETYKYLVPRYFRKAANIERVESKNPQGRADVGQVLYLSNPDDDSMGGLLIFLDEPEEQATVILPKEGREQLIASTPWLRDRILQRLPLNHQLSHSSSSMADIAMVSSSNSRKIDDVCDALTMSKLKRMLNDMNMIATNPTKRRVEEFAQAGVRILADLLMIPSLAGGSPARVAEMLVEFLAWSDAGALRALYAAHAEALEKAEGEILVKAARGLSDLAVPVLLESFELQLSPEQERQIAQAVYEHLIRSGQTLTLAGAKLRLDNNRKPFVYAVPSPYPTTKSEQWELLVGV